jgi:hypothetical protein
MVRNGHIMYRSAYGTTYHSHFVPAISYHSENHFRIITISYHMQIDTLLPFRTICRSIHYMTISYHMQIDTLYDHFVPYADRYIIWPFRTICRLTQWSYNVSICIWYEMVIMYRSAYGTKWLWYENDFHYDTKWQVRNGYGTKWL